LALVILVTGATGVVGTALLPQLLGAGHQVRALVRDPRRLGPQRVNVQLALVDLGDPHGLRHALRGCDTVIHLAAAIRDQPPRRVEEINGLGTLRLLRAAERAGAKRFLFFSALGATEFQRTRFFRSKALAEEAVLDAGLDATVFAPSIVYDRDDPFVTIVRRLALLPMLPISGEGRALYQPIWAQDVARAVLGWLDRDGDGGSRYELAGPEMLSHDDIARTIAWSAGRQRPLLHVPLPLVRGALIWLRRLVGENAFATWEEAELMEISMTTPNATSDAKALGVEPLAMREVLGGR
jgi:NADH dehydrogenase